MQKFEDVINLSHDHDHNHNHNESSSISQLNNVRLNFQKRKSEPFVNFNFEVGNINYDTPISYFLKQFYKKDLSCYIYHKDILFSESEKNFIFLLREDILITKSYEDENNTDNYNYATSNPILMKIDYKDVIR
jgi:hypothetical protein